MRCWVVSAGSHSVAGACTMSCRITGKVCGRGAVGASRCATEGEHLHLCQAVSQPPPPPRPSPEGRPGAVVGGPAVGLPPIADGGSRRGAHGLPHQTVATCAMRAVLVGFPHGPGPPQPPGCSHPLARPSRMVARGRWSGQSGGGAASMGASGPVLRLPTLGSSSTALLQPPRPRKRPRHPAIGGINMSPCRMWRVEAGPDPPACLERVCRGRGCPPVGQAGPATRLATGPLQDDLALLADGAPRSPGYRL